jgi:leucyl-tRNA synthetase
VQDIVEWIKSIARKWQSRWEAERVYEADPSSKQKFFVTAAFPYPNSPIHIGNARSYVLADVVARHRRTRGENVLYPMGFHYTGTPILTMAESIEEGDPELIDLFENLYNVPKEIALKLSRPIDLAQYFHRVSKDSMKMLGLGIDWRREFTTIDPYFSSFIRWQFETLRERGYLTRGTYPVGWCPKHSMPVGGHDTKDDKDPEIGEFTVIFFSDQGSRIFPAATLRPETIFGVTNIWINPKAEYVEANVSGKTWIVSKECYRKLEFQRKDIKLIRSVDPRELIYNIVINPVTGEKIPVLPAEFVDPGTGTGVVMSVPAHSPDDYAAYREIMRSREHSIKPLEPRVVIRVPGIKDLPAKVFVEKHRVRNQADRLALEAATKELYALEYSTGIMETGLTEYIDSVENKKILSGFVKGWIEGRNVPEARENIAKLLRLSGYGDTLYEVMNKPVYCRCGTEIVVKVLENQWFINYGDTSWKSKGLELLGSMYVQPPEMKDYMGELIRGLREKPCARTRGLGTRLPWDPSWIIESLSDSTIYMAFYTISHKIRSIIKDPSEIGNDLWSYIFLGKGMVEEISSRYRVEKKDLEDLRREFLYWYPLDLRVAGKDLANNHLLFFIMNHVAIFPKDMWPRSMLIHGWVLRDGKKMSKSLRNILPVFRAIDIYGNDVVRTVLSISSEVGQDLDFRHEAAINILEHLKKIYELADRIYRSRRRVSPNDLDLVYASRISRSILRADEALDRFKIREGGIKILYDIANYFSEYVQSVDGIWSDMINILKIWVIMLSIYIPHIAEEIWHEIFGEVDYVVKRGFDREALKKYINIKAELKYFYLKRVEEDIAEISALLRRKPTKVIIYVAPKSEMTILVKSIEAQRRGEGIRSLMNIFLSRTPGEARSEEAAKIKKIFDHASTIQEDLADMIMSIPDLDEFSTLRENAEMLRDRIGATEIQIYLSNDTNAPDYMGKKKEAVPLRPGIYIE